MITLTMSAGGRWGVGGLAGDQGREIAHQVVAYDAVVYKHRHKIEITFGRIKDWAPLHRALRPLRPHLRLCNVQRRSCHILAVINASGP